MNSHLNKEIFSETGCINKEVLMQYRDGKLRDSEKHQVEKHLVDCSLCSEALEGFAMVAGAASFDEVNERIQHLTTASQGAHFSRYVAIAASVAAIVTLSYFAYKQFDDVNVERLAVSETVVHHDTVVPVEINSTPVQAEELQTHTNSTNQINNRVAQPRMDQQVSESAAGVSANEMADNKQSVADEVQPAASISVQKEAANDAAITFSGTNIPAAAGYTSNISYVDNRKVIDYSALKVKETLSSKDTKSVPGKYENQIKKSEAEADEEKLGLTSKRNVNYLQLLQHPISLYNDAKYEAAIIEFDEILGIHPGDENAQFYKGMSLYYLKKYDQSINLLKPLSSINTQPFSEEALFYVAKSYAAKEDKSQAIAIFRSIVVKKGFYAERAKEELKKME